MYPLNSKILHSSYQGKTQTGFTLLELLVTIVIIAVLSGVALPSMLSQVHKARHAAAKSHVGSVNRAQQAYRLESPVFTNSLSALAVTVPLATDDYTYSFGTIDEDLAEFRATSSDSFLSSFTGCTNATTLAGNLATTTTTTIIEAPSPGDGSIATPPGC